MRHILLFIALALSHNSWSQKSLDQVLATYNSHSVSYISAAELKQLTSNNSEVIILDTREKEEYEVSRIPGAKFVGYNDFKWDPMDQEITNKDATIVVYCSLGIRSEEIGERLQKMGYKNVKNLYGGIFSWKNKGYTVVDALGANTQKVHTYNKHWSQWLLNGEKVYD